MTASIFSDIEWISPHQALETWQLDARLQSWLLDPSSLTARLHTCTSDFNVKVLRHAADAITGDEQAFMQLPEYAQCQVREVLLCDRQNPWVFARSVIPQASEGLLFELQNIGDRPLGEALFNHSGVTPGDFQLAIFSPPSQMAVFNTQLTGTTQTLYGRRRVFWVKQAPVLVAEVFLSSAPCYNLNTKS